LKFPHIIVHDHESGRTRVLRLNFKEEDNYEKVGKFVLNSMAYIVTSCAEQGIKPCIHLVPRQLTQEEFEKLDKADWHLEAEELIDAVERGDEV
jgi:hypothetical protein